jgi:hypothetical protein
MKNFIYGTLGLALVCLFIYGCYWVVKTVSYTIFYEDMVEQTIKETVKQSCLL